jgi:transcriptional regulator with XRE-family HTH domain
MALDPQASPAVARRRVRLALRKARQATGRSQGEIADELGWSLSKMQRIEAGDVSVSGTDLRAIIDLLGGFSPEEIKQLVDDTRVARRQRWWTAPEYRRHLTSGLMELIGFESEATGIRTYQPVLVPGVLQTSAVADTIFEFWSEDLDPEDRRVRQDVRALRRQQVIEREDAPQCHFVLDESVLDRNIGGTAIALEQLESLAVDARRPGVHLRVIPLAKGALLGLLGPFMLLGLNEEDDDEDDAVLYRESWNGDVIIHDRREIQGHRVRFEKLWTESWPEDVTLRRIEAQAAILRSELDRIDT